VKNKNLLLFGVDLRKSLKSRSGFTIMKLSCLFPGYGMKTSQDWRGGERERERKREKEKERE